MLTKITTPITFFKRFQTMRKRSIIKIGDERNQMTKKFNRHRRHYYMLFEALLTVSHPTKRNNVKSKGNKLWCELRDLRTRNLTQTKKPLRTGNLTQTKKPMTSKWLQHELSLVHRLIKLIKSRKMVDREKRDGHWIRLLESDRVEKWVLLIL